jgi:hypothetical protein
MAATAAACAAANVSASDARAAAQAAGDRRRFDIRPLRPVLWIRTLPEYAPEVT